jgi:dipeptidyl aminopeptidase/acylaminoacyl peptidase
LIPFKKQRMKNTFLLFAALLIGAASFSQKQTFTVEHLWKLKRLSGTAVSGDEKWIFYQSTSYDVAANKGTTTGYLTNPATGETKEAFPAGTTFWNVVWDNTNTLWWLQAGKSGTELARMKPGTNTVPTVVHVFDREAEGFVLSGNGQYLAVLEPVKVNKTVQDLHPDLTKTNARIETSLMYRHWNAWQSETALHLFLYLKSDGGSFMPQGDVMTGEPFASVTPPFGGIDDVTFGRDGKTLFYSTKKKSGTDFAQSTDSQIYAYDIASKQTTTVTTAKGYDTNPRVSPDGKQLAYLSMARDGFEADKNRIMLHDLATGAERELTAGIDVSTESFSWHDNGQYIYFTAAIKGTKQVFEVNAGSGKTRQLTNERCDILSINVGKDRIIAERQSMIAPTDIWQISIKTGVQKQLTAINKELMDNIALPTVVEKWVTTTDGKKMLVWVIQPPNFDENKQYPALLYCQGGPQSPVSQYFSYRWNFLLMASNGYVVMAPNRRGLPGFGQEWNDAISRDWGGQAMRDYLVTVDSVSTLPYIDKNRIGAVGASYGGYSVYYLAGIHDNRFKAFVSHCGLFNLESWYGTTEELFFANFDIGGPYWLPQNKELYEKNSPHNFVDKWNTPMLVIHGGKDFRVPESEGMQAFQVLQLKGIPGKYLYFPDEGHWITKPQNGVLWYRTYFDWLDTYLK